MGKFLSAWGFRIGMAAATLGGSAVGYAVSPSLEDEPQAIVQEHDEVSDGARLIPPPGTEGKSTEGNDDLSYEINVMGRQIVGPLTQVVTEPVANLMDAKGGFKMRHVARAQAGNDPNTLWGDKLSRDMHSRKTVLGRKLRELNLDKADNYKKLTNPADQRRVRDDGATLSKYSNYMFMTQHLMRLGTNLIAIHQMTNGTESNLSMAEKGVVFADTASVAGHSLDIGLYARGLGQIAKGQELRAINTLRLSHKTSIVSNSLQVGAGILRFYAEIERQEETGSNNASSIFYSFLDMGTGVCGIIYAGFLLLLIRRMRKAEESKAAEENEATEENEAAEESKAAEENEAAEKVGDESGGDDDTKDKTPIDQKKNNALLGITKLPPLVQDSIRLTTAFGASAAAGMNSTSMASVLTDPTTGDAFRDGIVFSGSFGLGGSLLALSASYFMRPGTYPLARIFFAGSSVLISVQTLHDFWPAIMQFLSGL